MRVFKVFLLLMSTFFISSSKAWSFTDLPKLNYYDKFVAYLLDKSISKSGYLFKETFIKINSIENKELSEPVSIGKALVINDKLNQSIEIDKFANSIITKIYVKDQFLGDFIFQWHPSKSFLMFALGFLLYRFDQAYLWPQFLVDQFPGLVKEKLTIDPLVIEWNKLSQIDKIKNLPSEFENLAMIFQKLQLINPSLDSVVAIGSVGSKSDRSKNKTQFTINFQIHFPETVRCEQHIESDFNPFRKEFSQIKGFYNCDTFDPETTGLSYKIEEL